MKGNRRPRPHPAGIRQYLRSTLLLDQRIPGVALQIIHTQFNSPWLEQNQTKPGGYSRV